ncbi:DUF7507 domain-containing protein, partial [Algoriphagus chordae]
TTIVQDAVIDITKSVDPTSISAPATLNYTINVTNEGNVSLTGVVVTDPFTDGVTPLALTGGDTDNDGELDLTEIWTYETSYAADQAAVDAGADIVNTAFVDSNETAQDQASATTTIIQNKAIEIVKSANLIPVEGEDCVEVTAGETVITYTFTVTNEGNVSLTGIEVKDELPGLSAINFVEGDDNNDGILDVNEIWTYNAEYTVIQANLESGLIENTAEVTTDDETVSDEDTLTIPLCQEADIAITKSASVDSEDDCYDTDDIVTYTFTVYNTGNVALNNVLIDETYHFTGTGALSDISFVESSENSAEGTLLPGENATYTATYTITDEDTELGYINNQAEVTAQFGATEVNDLSGETVVDNLETQVDLCQRPSIDITKTVANNDDVLGGNVVFELRVTNTGNTTLYNIYVEDETTGDNWTVLELAPEAYDIHTVIVPISQELIDAECYTNTAFAEVRRYFEEPQSPGSNEANGEEYEVIARDMTEAQACFTQNPELTIDKSIVSGDPYNTVDAEISYEYVVTNSGNLTLYGPFTVNDDKIGELIDDSNTLDLTPGATITFEGTYTVTQEDLTNMSVTNIATAIGYLGNEETIESDPDEATANSLYNDIIANDDDAGTYTIDGGTASINAFDNDSFMGGAANSGNVTLTTVIADPEAVLTVDSEGVITIAPDAEAGDYQLTYRITEIGNASNYAEAIITATVEPVLLLDEIESYCELDAPYLRWLLEPANFNLQDLAPGDPTPLTMIWYDSNDAEIIRFEDVPMEGYMLFPGADTLPGGYGSQWPGWRFVNEQWEAGDFNYAAVREPGAYVKFELNPEVSSEIAYPGATEACDPNPNPPIAIDDDMTGTPVVSANGYEDIVNVLDNDMLGAITGLNTTLVDISIVSESTPGVLSLDLTTGLVSVAPNTPSGTYTLEYRICTNPNPTNCDTAVVTVLVVTPSIELLKDGVFNDDITGDGFAQVGESVTYTFSVENTGDIELTDVTLVDDKVTVIGGPIATLAAGDIDTNTFTATYILTQEDIDSGVVLNLATVSAEGPRGNPNDPSDDVTDESSDPTPVTEPTDP